jgi:hypothetical protein
MAKTFSKDQDLPPLPLPRLQDTLSLYLESAKPLLSQDEYEHTELVVKEFESGIGKTLQEILSVKAAGSKNWVDAYRILYANISNLFDTFNTFYSWRIGGFHMATSGVENPLLWEPILVAPGFRMKARLSV